MPDVAVGEALFVGGPKDGEILTVELRYSYRVMKTPPPVRLFVDNPETQFETVEYRLMPFAGEKFRHLIYVVDGMTADEVMRTLIAGYAKSRSKS